MLKPFNIAERGAGSYWVLGILRWVMVLIFISFGIQKFTPQSAQGIALYISNSPFVSWLSMFGMRGEAYIQRKDAFDPVSNRISPCVSSFEGGQQLSAGTPKTRRHKRQEAQCPCIETLQ